MIQLIWTKFCCKIAQLPRRILISLESCTRSRRQQHSSTTFLYLTSKFKINSVLYLYLSWSGRSVWAMYLTPCNVLWLKNSLNWWRMLVFSSFVFGTSRLPWLMSLKPSNIFGSGRFSVTGVCYRLRVVYCTTTIMTPNKVISISIWQARRVPVMGNGQFKTSSNYWLPTVKCYIDFGIWGPLLHATRRYHTHISTNKTSTLQSYIYYSS